MSVLEVLVATSLLTVFAGVFVAVMEITFKYIDDANAPDSGSLGRVRIESLFDQMEEVLVQPGVNISQLNKISSPLTRNPSFDKCIEVPSPTNPAIYAWTSDIPELPELPEFPLGYRLCLWRTVLIESKMECLLKLTAQESCNKPVSPGIYVLQALPFKLSASSLPVRRLLCRPRPFC